MRPFAFVLCLLFLLSSSSLLLAQARDSNLLQKKRDMNVVNPFDLAAKQSQDEFGGMEGEMMAMGGAEEMEMGGMGGGFGSVDHESRQFRRGLEIAITMLRKENDPQKRKKLQQYVRDAFDNRYTQMITKRKKDIARLQASLQKLENDLKRRESAKSRVIELQMQSVQLAAEGILELQDIQPQPGGASDFGAN